MLLRNAQPESYLVHGVIQHDGSAYGHSRLILHELIEGALVVVAPMVKKWTCTEQHFGKFLERQRRELRILFADEVFVEPMPMSDRSGVVFAPDALFQHTLVQLGNTSALGNQILHPEDLK